MLQKYPNFLKTIITDDETWLHHLDHLIASTKCTWKHSDSKRLRKKKKKNPTNKIFWKGHDYYLFDHKGVIYQESVPPQNIGNGKYYISVLKCLRENISRNHQELVSNWTSHCDNTLPYVASFVLHILVNKILKSKHIPVIVQFSHHAISDSFHH